MALLANNAEQAGFIVVTGFPPSSCADKTLKTGVKNWNQVPENGSVYEVWHI